MNDGAKRNRHRFLRAYCKHYLNKTRKKRPNHQIAVFSYLRSSSHIVNLPHSPVWYCIHKYSRDPSIIQIQSVEGGLTQDYDACAIVLLEEQSIQSSDCIIGIVIVIAFYYHQYEYMNTSLIRFHKKPLMKSSNSAAPLRRLNSLHSKLKVSNQKEHHNAANKRVSNDKENSGPVQTRERSMTVRLSPMYEYRSPSSCPPIQQQAQTSNSSALENRHGLTVRSASMQDSSLEEDREDAELVQIYADSIGRDSDEFKILAEVEASRDSSGRHCLPFKQPLVFIDTVQNELPRPQPRHAFNSEIYTDLIVACANNRLLERGGREPNNVCQIPLPGSPPDDY